MSTHTCEDAKKKLKHDKSSNIWRERRPSTNDN